MARLADTREIVQRPPSLARDAVACVVLFVVGNVCASVTWDHYVGNAAAATSRSVRIYAATPLGPHADPDAPVPAARAGVTRASSTLVAACSVDSPPSVTIGSGKRFDEPDSAREHDPMRLLGDAQDYACPNSMRLVDGVHCPMPVHECLEYLSVERDRCKQYVASAPCVGTPIPKRFCIDDYEYPNQAGSLPMVWVNYQQAAEYCSGAGKRLCTSSEWELACEGPERAPYATGFVRDSARCNFDRPNIVADNDALANPRLRDAEFARVDQREPSGARPNCVSYFGVHDLTGNVDEWVQNDTGNYDKPPYRSALKGGYWGKVRNRCRPTTTDHNAWHQGYQIGFRCCTEAAMAYAANR